MSYVELPSLRWLWLLIPCLVGFFVVALRDLHLRINFLEREINSLEEKHTQTRNSLIRVNKTLIAHSTLAEGRLLDLEGFRTSLQFAKEKGEKKK